MAGGSGDDDRRSVGGAVRAAMEPRPDGRGKPYDRPAVPRRPGTAAMEPRPDGRGKVFMYRPPSGWTLPQWSPGLMAGGRPYTTPLTMTSRCAAMEPRPDGRGKSTGSVTR